MSLYRQLNTNKNRANNYEKEGGPLWVKESK